MLLKKHRLFGFIVILFVLSSCGGGGGGGGGGSATTSNANNSTETIEGIAVKGPIANATVSLYSLHPNGAQSSLILSTTTDANGRFSLEFENSSTPYLLTVVSGSFVDEATGNTIFLSDTPGFNLSAVITAIPTGNLSITPLTTMAARLARKRAQASLDIAREAAIAHSQVSQYFGFDILTTAPADLADGQADNAGSPATSYGLLLAALSQQATALFGSQSGYNVLDLVTAMANDITDGALDGIYNANPIVFSNVNGPGGHVNLAQNNYIAETAGYARQFLEFNSHNQSGLSIAAAFELQSTFSASHASVTGPYADAVNSITTADAAETGAFALGAPDYRAAFIEHSLALQNQQLIPTLVLDMGESIITNPNRAEDLLVFLRTDTVNGGYAVMDIEIAGSDSAGGNFVTLLREYAFAGISPVAVDFEKDSTGAPSGISTLRLLRIRTFSLGRDQGGAPLAVDGIVAARYQGQDTSVLNLAMQLEAGDPATASSTATLTFPNQWPAFPLSPNRLNDGSAIHDCHWGSFILGLWAPPVDHIMNGWAPHQSQPTANQYVELLFQNNDLHTINQITLHYLTEGNTVFSLGSFLYTSRYSNKIEVELIGSQQLPTIYSVSSTGDTLTLNIADSSVRGVRVSNRDESFTLQRVWGISEIELRNIPAGPELPLTVMALDNADLSLVDPIGLQLTPTVNQIADSQFLLRDLNGNSYTDHVAQLQSSSNGLYTLFVARRAGAQASDTYGIQCNQNGSVRTLAKNIQVPPNGTYTRFQIKNSDITDPHPFYLGNPELTTSSATFLAEGFVHPDQSVTISGGFAPVTVQADAEGRYSATVLLKQNQINRLTITRRETDGFDYIIGFSTITHQQ